MGNKTTAGDGETNQSVTFALSERVQAAHFEALFKEGMALVERTASYLDGPGRNESKGLPPPITVLYATESMRLTARLLDIASWLLLRRALRDGEISEGDAAAKRKRLKLQPIGRPSHTKGFDELPDSLRGLIEESFEMLSRINELDSLPAGPSGLPDTTTRAAPSPVNPVGAQVIRLHDAFRRS